MLVFMYLSVAVIYMCNNGLGVFQFPKKMLNVSPELSADNLVRTVVHTHTHTHTHTHNDANNQQDATTFFVY